MRVKDKKCLIKNCEKQAFARGLCQGCYVSASRYVKEKKTTWEELIKHNLATGSKNYGKTSNFLKAFYLAKGKKVNK